MIENINSGYECDQWIKDASFEFEKYWSGK